jgi:hypothetical protein
MNITITEIRSYLKKLSIKGVSKLQMVQEVQALIGRKKAVKLVSEITSQHFSKEEEYHRVVLALVRSLIRYYESTGNAKEVINTLKTLNKDYGELEDSVKEFYRKGWKAE